MSNLGGEALRVPNCDVVDASGLIGSRLRDECGGRRPIPTAVGHASDVIVFGVRAIPFGLEVPSQDEEVVWESVC